MKALVLSAAIVILGACTPQPIVVEVVYPTPTPWEVDMYQPIPEWQKPPCPTPDHVGGYGDRSDDCRMPSETVPPVLLP